jgi:hypothetical protein
MAVTSQSTRRRISKKLCNELATALIVRSFASDIGKLDQVRRYLRHAFSQAVYAETWDSTSRDTDSLEREALAEVERAMGDDTIVEAGPASLELSVRGAYALVVTGGLHSDRGTRGTAQPDRRVAGEVLDSMRRGVPGVRQLAQALRDFDAGHHIRAVDENGEIKKRSDGAADLVVNDSYLRQEFPPPGKTRARSGGPTPTEQLNDRLADLSDAMEELEAAFKAVAAVAGNDGSPLVEVEGVDPSFCATRRQSLSRIGDELNFWDRTFRRRHGMPAVVSTGGDTEEEEDDIDEFDNASDADSELAEEDQDGTGDGTIAEAKGGAR